VGRAIRKPKIREKDPPSQGKADGVEQSPNQIGPRNSKGEKFRPSRAGKDIAK
jgi:hypothetical protein